MALLSRKTQEEKWAEQRARDEERHRREVEAERETVEQAAAEARAQAAYGRFTRGLPKWEYKVLSEAGLTDGKSGTIKGLEATLNAYAADGWRAIGMSFSGPNEQFLAGNENHLCVVLERPARNGGHAGHPVQPRQTGWERTP